MLLTKQLLINVNACDTGIAFCERNQLFGFDLDLLHTVTGDYNYFVDWLKDKLSCGVFDKNGNMIQRTSKPFGITETWEYDDNRLLMSHTIGSSHEVFTYNEFGKLVTFVDGPDLRTYQYDDNQNMIRLDSHKEDFYHYWEDWTYSNTNKELTYMDSHGNHIEWTYDELDNQVTQHTTRGIDGSVELIEATYDDNGRVSSKTRDSGRVEYWVYDDMDNILSYKEVFPDPDGEEYHLVQTFDSNGHRLTASWNGDSLEQWVYDDHGNITSYINNDVTTNYTYEYWPNGQLKQGNGLYIPLINKD